MYPIIQLIKCILQPSDFVSPSPQPRYEFVALTKDLHLLVVNYANHL